eukprot:2776907-Rhodomonas_salina.1
MRSCQAAAGQHRGNGVGGCVAAASYLAGADVVRAPDVGHVLHLAVHDEVHDVVDGPRGDGVAVGL